jgi:hypothetical protein
MYSRQMFSVSDDSIASIFRVSQSRHQQKQTAKSGEHRIVRTARRFEWTYRLHLHFQSVRQAKIAARSKPVSFRTIRCYNSRAGGYRDRAVGIATGYVLDDRRVGVRVPVRAKFFSSPRRPNQFWSPPSFLSKGYQGIFFSFGVKRPESETDHSVGTSAEVTNMWIYTSTPHSPYTFMV